MTGVNMRKIVKIDEEKCNGCGICIPSCAEGALKIIDGKARLVSEKYCDGLGACLGECPEGAIAIEERPADEFDEAAVKEYLEVEKTAIEELPCGCASSTVRQITRDDAVESAGESGQAQPSRLGHWPVQLTLVPPGAPFLNGADLLLVADCVPFAYGNFHRDFLQGHSVIVACPKLDDFDAHQVKFNEILKKSDIKSLTVVHMEVPCCSGLIYLARQALLASEKSVPLREITISMHGDILK
jgi:NAD-dependent dihydropyrimidine dehydrogenase PreA subunit